MYIRDRLYFGALFSIILLVIVASITLLASDKAAKENREHTMVMDLKTAISELDVVTYEYLLHHGTRAEQQWVSKYSSIGGTLEKAEEELVELLKADYAALGDLFSQITKNYEEIQRLTLEGDSQEETDMAVLLEERLVAQLLIKSHSIMTNSSRLAEKAHVETAEAQGTANAVNLLLMVILVATVTTVSFVIARSISKPLDKLTRGAEIIGKGNLEHRIDVKSKDEIGELAAAFNQMTGDIKKAEYKLRERMKELSCIYETSKIMGGTTDLNKALSEVAEIIPPAYGFPELACARITYNGNEYKTKNFRKTAFGQSASIELSDKKVGTVEVFYLAEAPFLMEESKMIKEVASQIGSISERRKAEERTTELAVEKARAKEAEAVAEELKKLSEMKDEFLNIAAHELRTPLTAIRWNASLIMQRFRESLKDEKVKGMINDMHGASIHLTEIVNDFLDVSRLEAGRVDFKKEAVDLGGLVKQCLEGLKVVASKKSLYLKFEEPKRALPKVTVDKGRVEQIIVNLVGNAIKFTDKGGINAEVITEGGFLKVRIKDTGIGIGKDSQKLLFQKFQQSGKGPYTKDATRGTGLGLYITRLLVEGMGGKVYLERSESGKGSTFAFTLPVAKTTSSVSSRQVSGK